MAWKNKQATLAPKTIEFPKSLLVKVVHHGTNDEFLLATANPSEFTGDDDESVKTARYVLAGTGVVEHSAPVYVEHASA